MLASLPQHKLEEVANDEAFLANLNRVYDSYQEYMSAQKWFEETAPEQAKDTIAYFSCEYGIDTGLPVYSGGLGVLSGAKLKTG